MDGSGQRRHRVPLGLVCLVLLVIGNVKAGEDVCRTGCRGGAAKTFKYAVGMTYKYNYDGKIEISLSSAEGQSTSTEVKAEVLLTEQTDCNQILTLRNVQVLGSAGKKVGTIPDIEKPIRLNFNDGVLDDSICIVDGDNQNSINVKRAIASLFQASLKSGYETDVFGLCPTESSSHKEGNILVIHKSRNLNKCSFREHIQQDFLATVFNLNSEIKSSPILNGDYQATLKVKNGILEQAIVTEDYIYVPFSVGKNGAKARISSKLQFSGVSKETSNPAVSTPRSIIFENPHPIVASASNPQTILSAVKEVAKTIDQVVGETTAKEFVSLIKVIRVSKKNDLLAVYNQVKSGGIGIGDKEAVKRFYLDALLRAGNGDSLEAVLELVTKHELNQFETKLALLGLSFVRHATEGSLNAAVHLLDFPNLPREAYLGIGNLAGRFCRQHSCENVAAFKSLTDKILSKIGNKINNREQENGIIYALKALANFHYLNNNVLQKLSGLAQNKNFPNRVRVAALEAYLADPCKDKLRDSALHILQDIQQDSEVRIKAYLVVAQCPNAKAGNAVKALLEKEPSLQVGGFITSHIRNIRASANPDKLLAKQHLGFSPKKRFPIDPRKYSFNGEFSYAIDTLGLAASTEANVIYSQNSWLPRSSSLNLTAEVFGHTLNFLEIETRQENLDRLVEHYLGPKGLLKSSDWFELLHKGHESINKIADHIEDKLKSELHRSKRDVSKAEIEHIAKQVQIKAKELNNDLDLDLSLKAFGSELFFLNINQDAAKLTPESITDDLVAQLGQGLDWLKHFEKTQHNNLLFLDAEFDYPTSLGFPLRLAVEGTSSVQIKTDGQVDVRRILNSPENGQLNLKVIPSANIEVAGRLTLDALVVENGLKVVTSLYSSSGGDINLSWDKTSGFQLKFGLPVKEQKLISINHEIVFHTREQAGREQNLPLKFTQVKDFSICFDQLSAFIGLTFCADINGPNLGGQQIPILPFPLAGDAKIAVTIENDDILEYRIRSNIKGNQSPTYAELIFESIGNNNQRKVALQLEAQSVPESYVRARFISPTKEALVELRRISTNVEQSVYLLWSNDRVDSSIKIGVDISGSPERTIYKPILEFKTPQGSQVLPLNVQGQIVAERNGPNFKYIFENVKIIDQKRQIGINGNIGRDGEVFFSDLTLSDGTNSVALEGRIQVATELIKFNIKVQNSINSNANFNLKGELKKQAYLFFISIQLTHGPDLNSKKSVLTISHSLVKKIKTSTDFRIETKNSISYPLLGLIGKFEFEQTAKSLDYEIKAEYGDIKLGSELEIKINEKNDGDYELEFDIWGLDNKLELKSRRQVLGNDESKIFHSLEVNGNKVQVDGKIKHYIRPLALHIGADLTVTLPYKSKPLVIKVSNGLNINTEELDAYQKISSGNDNVVDAFLKSNKAGNANGSIKANIFNLLSINGQLHANNGIGNGDILIDLQNGKRQLKGETSFKIPQSEVFDVAVTIYPSFNKDKNLKIYFSTQNKISETSIDTKNKLDILGHPLEVNAKLSKTGNRKSGKLDGEFEVTLPGDQYLSAKANCDHKEISGLLSGQSQGIVEYRANKNAAGSKLGYKTTWRNSNPEERILDADLTVSADDSNGQNVNLDISVKLSKPGDTELFKLSNKVYGSILKHSLEGSIISQIKNDVVGQYELHGSYGPDNNILIKGNYDVSEETKGSGGFDLQLSTESNALKTLNMNLRGSVVTLADPSQLFQLEGSANLFADDDGTNPEAIIDFKSDCRIKLSATTGDVKGSLTIDKSHPITLIIRYHSKDASDIKQDGGSIIVNYGGAKTVKFDASLLRTSDHQYKLSTLIETPVEGYKDIQFRVEVKISKENKEVNGAAQLAVEGRSWNLETDLILNDLAPVIDIRLTHPEIKLSQIYLRGSKISGKQFSGEIKLIHEVSDFTFQGDLDVDVENLESFTIKGSVNSPRLKINKVTFEARNNPGAGDRKIQVIIKSGGKNLISGSTSYAAKEENGKFIVEGSGTFKVKDETKSGNFKYILQRLSIEKNAEQGIEISFDAVLGKAAIDSEFKVTNKQFRLQNSYCEEKKECAYVEIDNKVNKNELNSYNQVLEINLDLRKLGLSHEFGLKAETHRNGWNIEHTVDVHFQNQEKSKYQYSFYIRPQESGISLTTPKRIISWETKYNPPKNYKEGGKGSGEIAFYADKKNHANKKTALSWFLDVDPKGKLNGEIKFTHPGLQKALVSSIRATRKGNLLIGELDVVGELDVFAHPNQKIIATYRDDVSINDAKDSVNSKASLQIKSAGLGIDIQMFQEMLVDKAGKVLAYEEKLKYHVGNSNYENIMSARLSENEFMGLLRLWNVDVLKVHHRLQLSRNEQIIESEVSSYNKIPVVSRLEVKNLNTLAYSIEYKNTPNEKLLFNAGLIPGQIADIRSDFLSGNSKKNLFYATVKLDDAEFLKSDHKVDSKAIQEVLQKIKEHSGAFLNGLENKNKEWADGTKNEIQQIGDLLKKSAPNLKPLKQYYSKEINEIKQEILDDKSIKELSEAIGKVLESFIGAVSQIVEKISQLVEQIARTLQNSFQSVIDAVEKDVIPLFKQVASRLLAISRGILESSLDIVFGILGKASQILEEYQQELRELASAFEALGQEFVRAFLAYYQVLTDSVNTLIDRASSELKASKWVEEMKAQYEQFLKEGLPNADVIVNSINEIANTIKDIIPPELIVRNDIIEFLDTLTGYIEKKLKNQPVNDIATFEKLAQTTANIVKKLINIVSTESYEVPGANLDSADLLPNNYLKNLPGLVLARFSAINYLLDQSSATDINKFLLSLVNTPRRLLPPFSLYGLVIQGQHIFSFDGKHITFPGSCNYLLARDAVNGNFTLAGTYKDGLLTAITLADKNDFITLHKGGQVKLNNVASELPARKAELAAYRDYEIITLRSTAGVKVECTPDLSGCAVSVSGFYHGQLKGILGNGNNEPYDDLTLPAGKIVSSEGEFANAYKMTTGCADVTVPSHEQVPENPVCNKLFGWESPLRLCYPFVPTENFKVACAHGMAANIKGTEEAIAMAYVAACQDRDIPIHMPEELVKCTNADKPYSVGDTFSVKLPSKAADIVLIIDTSKSNEQLYKHLAQPLIQELGKELLAKGVNDVEFHLITYGGANQWPSHVTVNGKLTFKGKLPQLKFEEDPDVKPKPIPKRFVYGDYNLLQDFLHDVNLAIGKNLKADTFAEAHKYPFRVNALKSIVVINGKACEVGRFYPLQKLFALLFRNSQISLNLFTPFSTLSLKDTKKAKDIVGFNSENVFTLSHGKKNPRGNAELHKDLNYDDYCVDFTLKNRGNAFVNDNFVANKADQKNFVHIAAVNIVDQLVKVEQGLDCECKLVNPWNALNVCKEAFIRDRQTKKV